MPRKPAPGSAEAPGGAGVSRRGAIAAAATLGAVAATGADAGERRDGGFGGKSFGGKSFGGKIGPTLEQSRPDFSGRVQPRPGSPNVVVILLDDVGFADLGCYGGEIETPSIDALAGAGLRYTNFRTTAVCSSTRASLLTGLNPHSAGMGWLAELDSGFPGYRGDLTHDAVTLPEALRSQGYSTYQCGKWHLNNAETSTSIGPMDNWPLQRGFDRAYWFHGHSTHYFAPSSLFEGNQRVAGDRAPGYYVTDDLTDRAIAYLSEHRTQAPDRPFFLYLAHAAAHSPLHARREDLERVRGRYDTGWDTVRDRRLARQKRLGVVADSTRLPPRNPGVSAWADLSPDEQKLHARYMETYAAVLERADFNVGRLIEALKQLGLLDNTLLILASDNGGSPDGGVKGSTNLMAGLNGGVTVDQALARLDEIGGPDTYPMYPIGWAMASNTPFRLYKHDTHLGGVADPLIIHWPSAVKARGEVRRQYVHVIDLLPTILDCVGCTPPASYQGRRMRPIQGVSFKASLGAANAPETRLEQHFEMNGLRALYADGWRLVSTGRFMQPGDRWELFDLRAECNEITDLSAKDPRRVAAMEARWLEAAHRFDVFPIDTRDLRQKTFTPFFRGGGRSQWELTPPLAEIPEHAAPHFFGRSHRIDVEISPFRPGDQGVLLAYGNQFIGFVLYVKGGWLWYEAVSAPAENRVGAPIPPGARHLAFEQTLTERPWRGRAGLFADSQAIASLTMERAIFGGPMQGLRIGANEGAPVSHRYTQPFTYAGDILKLRVRLDAAPYSPEELRRFDAAFGRPG